jgi:hypothetical protein
MAISTCTFHPVNKTGLVVYICKITPQSFTVIQYPLCPTKSVILTSREVKTFLTLTKDI